MPDDRDYWDEEDELVLKYPLRVHRMNARWVCMCLRFARTGRCPHLVPFLPKETVEVSEEYL